MAQKEGRCCSSLEQTEAMISELRGREVGGTLWVAGDSEVQRGAPSLQRDDASM